MARPTETLEQLAERTREQIADYERRMAAGETLTAGEATEHD